MCKTHADKAYHAPALDAALAQVGSPIRIKAKIHDADRGCDPEGAHKHDDVEVIVSYDNTLHFDVAAEVRTHLDIITRYYTWYNIADRKDIIGWMALERLRV